jgi:hypothetical protein
MVADRRNDFARVTPRTAPGTSAAAQSRAASFDAAEPCEKETAMKIKTKLKAGTIAATTISWQNAIATNEP